MKLEKQVGAIRIMNDAGYSRGILTLGRPKRDESAVGETSGSDKNNQESLFMDGESSSSRPSNDDVRVSVAPLP